MRRTNLGLVDSADVLFGRTHRASVGSAVNVRNGRVRMLMVADDGGKEVRVHVEFGGNSEHQSLRLSYIYTIASCTT